MQQIKQFFRKLNIIIVSIIIGLTLSAFFNNYLRSNEKKIMINAFNEDVAEREYHLKAFFEHILLDLSSVRSFYDASNLVSSLESKIFTKRFMTSKAFRTIQYVPIITATERDQFESTISSSNSLPFNITEANQKGEIIRAKYREKYYPITFIEPFHRGKKVGNISGTGLGLAVLQRAIELHKGKIEVESEIGKGSNFTVILPFV